MKNTLILRICLLNIHLLLITSCSVYRQQGRQHQLTITNPTQIERADELVILERAKIEQKLGELFESEYISISTDSKKDIVVQLDDLNKDQKWDEAVFLYTFKPSESVRFNIAKTSAKAGEAVVRAHVRIRKKNSDNTFGPQLDSVTVPGNTAPTDFSKQKLPLFLTEGPAWENDRVAFRIYMDTRNTKDIYGKITRSMMMDTVGVVPQNSYHNLSEWGMDILAVGKSLGAGSLALSVPDANGNDTLVRLAGRDMEQITFEKVADGPVRGMLRMHYKNWTTVKGAAPVNVTEEISIWGGKFFYQSRVIVSNAPPAARIVTGIVNLKSKKSTEMTTGGCKLIYTYDAQSENKDMLGLAVMAKNEYTPSFGKTRNSGSEILNTYTVSMPVNAAPVEFRFVAAWERSDLLFTKEESFKKYLENEAIKYGRNMDISWN